ncbi:MAG: hypothetical protein PHF00_08145 [Elusimicrobia bacterium]|nr:hypothetical protein [Elusimicrobiota bacterium]
MNKTTSARAARILLAAAAWLLAPSCVSARIGLAARFGDVVIEGLEPGRTYDLREQVGVPFAVENRGDAQAEVTVEFELPSASVLAPGYEAVPDPTWFKAIPEKMTLGPHSLGYFELLVSIPDDPALKGKNYQVTIYAHTGPSGMFAVGVRNKLRFSIGPGPATLAEEKRKKSMQRLDFDVTPKAIYLNDVPTGVRYDVLKEGRKSIRVANYAEEPLRVALSVSPEWDRRFALPDGYEPMPDPSWLVFKSSIVVVAGGEIGQGLIELRVPDETGFKGKKYAAVVTTALEQGFWLDAPVRVFFETKP